MSHGVKRADTKALTNKMLVDSVVLSYRRVSVNEDIKTFIDQLKDEKLDKANAKARRLITGCVESKLDN